jgi:hypothetical protein
MSIGQEIEAELAKARAKHAAMNSAHEGYAVILEELDELWDEIKAQVHDKVKMRKEAIQVAAMAARFVEDVCGMAAVQEPQYAPASIFNNTNGLTPCVACGTLKHPMLLCGVCFGPK